MLKGIKSLLKNKKGNYVQIMLLLPVLLFLLVLIGVELDYVSTRNSAEEDAKTALRYIVREKNGNAARSKLISVLNSLGEEHNINYSNYKAYIYNVNKQETEDYDYYDVSSEGERIPLAEWGEYTVSNGEKLYHWRIGNIVELQLFDVDSGIYNQTADICFMGNQETCVNIFKKSSEVVLRMSIEYAKNED